MPVVRFGIVSDLHCRLEGDPKDSFLTTSALRMPSNRHPVQSLIELVHSEGITVDALLVPGDLTNRAQRAGLVSGWEFAKEIGNALHAGFVVPVIGNHDVMSRRRDATLPVFHDVQNLAQNFPFATAEANASYFAHGYSTICSEDIDIIAINTVIDGTDEESAKRGTFSEARIAQMEAALAGVLHAPLRIAVMHHHPILHSGGFWPDTDVLPFGDQLLETLTRLGCRLIVHGHKHIPRLSQVNGMTVLASGSFSAMLGEYSTSFGNAFHILTLEGNSPDDVRGTIQTWSFGYGTGWRTSSRKYNGFPHMTGFGHSATIPQMAQSLITLADSNPGKDHFVEHEISHSTPDLAYVPPYELDLLNTSLSPHDLKLIDHDTGQLELWKEYRP